MLSLRSTCTVIQFPTPLASRVLFGFTNRVPHTAEPRFPIQSSVTPSNQDCTKPPSIPSHTSQRTEHFHPLCCTAAAGLKGRDNDGCSIKSFTAAAADTVEIRRGQDNVVTISLTSCAQAFQNRLYQTTSSGQETSFAEN